MSDDEHPAQGQIPMVPFDPRVVPQDVLATALPGQVFLLIVMPQVTLQLPMDADGAEGLADRIREKVAEARGLMVVPPSKLQVVGEVPLTVEDILNPKR